MGNKKQFKVLAIGGITEDIMFHTGDLKIISSSLMNKKTLFAFEMGDKILNDEKVLYTFGGGGANIAVSLSRLGIKTALLGAIGSDSSGERARDYFKKEKIDVSGLQVIKDYWTGLSFIVTAGKQSDHVSFLHRAANERLALTPKMLNKYSADCIYLTSLSGEGATKTLATVFKFLKKNQIIVWNPGNAQLRLPFAKLKPFLKRTNLLILNRNEALKLLTSAGKSVKDSSLQAITLGLQELGPDTVAVTDSEKGAGYVDKSGEYYFSKAMGRKVVNTVGAGDAFGSSLLGGLILFKDPEKALKLGLLRSGLVVEHIGAHTGLLTMAQLKKRYHI